MKVPPKDAEIYPEMSGKILDESHFKFHVEAKAKVLNAINKMKQGKDMIAALSHINFSTDPKWIKNSCKDPNVKTLLDILEEYKKVEHRPTRAKVLIPLIEYAIALFASDLFYKERGEWFLYQILIRHSQFRLNKFFVDPKYWYPLTRNDGGYWLKTENDPNVPPIEQEYLVWYGIDVMKDTIDIPEETRKRIVAENIAWMKENAPQAYYQFTGDKEPLDEYIRVHGKPPEDLILQ